MLFQQLLLEYENEEYLENCNRALMIDNNQGMPDKFYSFIQRIRQESIILLDQLDQKRLKYISTIFNKDCLIKTVAISSNQHLVELCQLLKSNIKHFEILNMNSACVHLIIDNLSDIESVIIAIRHCDLEDIDSLLFKLKNYKLEKLLIENSNLTDTNADAIIDFITTNQTIIAFSLFDASLQSRSVDILKSTFANKSLQRLRFDQETLGKEGLEYFIDFFKNNKTVVGYGLTCIDWSEMDFDKFIEAMESNYTYQSLDFYGCTFTNEQLGQLTSTIIKSPNLEEIDFTVVKVLDGTIEPHLKTIIQHNVGLRSISFFGLDTNCLQIVEALKSNYYVTEINPKDRYYRPDVYTSNEHIQMLLARNKKIQSEKTRDFLLRSRTLSMINLPTEILFLIFQKICKDCMITRKEKELFYFLLDNNRLGIKLKEFNMSSLIEYCTKQVV
ncbi:hypothetical protein HK103_003944 [Boothiomyces macroporosus]|uniref:Uncharacterized protein n=1 Tax=Boothiomyces macroporosus TaxID=261099 RepID=A0AAD5UMD3_9FUNG|nr:hypothetical protein HK103_003944 [Boothiomyces macroporosus]